MTGGLTADGLLRRLGLPAVAVLYALYVAYFVQLTSLPLQDYPNHVARAVVLGDLIFHHGARFGQVFSFHIVAAPYLLTDLLLTVCFQAEEAWARPLGARDPAGDLGQRLIQLALKRDAVRADYHLMLRTVPFAQHTLPGLRSDSGATWMGR